MNNCIFRPSSDIKVTLTTVLLCTTLKPNGKISGNFVWLDIGLTNSEKESNTLNVSVFATIGSSLSGYNVFQSSQCVCLLQ